MLTDAGIPALMFYLIMALGVLLAALSKWKTRNNSILFALGTGAIGIILHSTMDFELSELAIFYTLAFLIGGIRAIKLKEHDKEKYYPQISINYPVLKPILILFACLLIIVSPLQRTSIYYGAKAVEAYNQGNSETAYHFYLRSSKLNPFESSILVDLAQLELLRGIVLEDTQIVNKAFKRIERAEKINEFGPNVKLIAANMYSAIGYNEVAYNKAKEALKLSPWFPGRYEDLAEFTLRYAGDLIVADKKIEAKELLIEVTEIPYLIDSKLNELSDTHKDLWISEPKLVVTPILQTKVDKAVELLNEI